MNTIRHNFYFMFNLSVTGSKFLNVMGTLFRSGKPFTTSNLFLYFVYKTCNDEQLFHINE